MDIDSNQLIKAADIVPVLDDVQGLLEDVLKAYDEAQTKIAQLETESKSKDKIILEKVATVAPTPMFKTEALTGTLDRLQEMNIIDESMATKIASDIQRDPHEVLGLLTKISEALLRSPNSEGMGLEKEAGYSDSDPDPDGWIAMSMGRRVKLKP